MKIDRGFTCENISCVFTPQTSTKRVHFQWTLSANCEPRETRKLLRLRNDDTRIRADWSRGGEKSTPRSPHFYFGPGIYDLRTFPSMSHWDYESRYVTIWSQSPPACRYSFFLYIFICLFFFFKLPTLFRVSSESVAWLRRVQQDNFTQCARNYRLWKKKMIKMCSNYPLIVVHDNTNKFEQMYYLCTRLQRPDVFRTA